MALLRFRYPLSLPLSSLSSSSPAHGCRRFRCAAGNQALFSVDATKLVLEVKEKLEREHPNLPVGKNGRDDEDMILWFLKDRKFSVEETVMKLTKAITLSFQKWHEDFGVSDLCEESVKSVYGTGKAYVHDFLDNNGRPVLVVVASKHFPAVGNTRMDVFYYYYPRRLGQVLFVDAPFVFQPIWQLVKPLMRSYASLVRFCDMETVRKEYFTESTVPTDFKD
ncbi:uncharacterized protein LOC135619346 isoform X5 [Musa acuminata AAA Group]|uniref:uncharacterized protein LOC135619346 isoform X5 n=1 Tax=Musa acuminata AAA Group TaxID=214697 RepID=UPI0031E47640